ncbi:MAG: serine hydrolase domain-containing protein [Pseudomonadota bacterium]
MFSLPQTLRSRALVAIALCWLGTSTSGASDMAGGYALGVVTGADGLVIDLHGMADPESGTPVSSKTVFHIASLSKQITAAALAMAIREGRVSLDDPLMMHVPEAAHYGSELNVGHLLYFTSGLTEAYDVPRDGGIPWTTQYYFTVDDAIEASLSVPELQFEPGSEWRYNNINFQLIAELLERVYGQPFSALTKEKLFMPLGMTATLINDDITLAIPNRAPGVVPRIPEAVEQLRSAGIDARLEGGPMVIRRNAPHYGGSGVMTSMEDWLKWQREMLLQEVFGKEFWELMFSTRAYDHPKANDAFGLVHSDLDGVPTVWFAGNDIDGSSYMLASPTAQLAAACFSNNPLFDCRAEAQQAFRRALED